MFRYPAVTPLALLPALAAGPAKVSFNKDVLPVLQQKCQECHRPGEVAPVPFMTYSETPPWAKAIREAVVSTTDEMAVSFMGFIVGVNEDPMTLFPRRGVRQVVE